MSLPAIAPPADRLEALGRPKSLRRKPEGGPPQLTAKHRLLIAYMIDGVQHPGLLARIKRRKAVLDEQGQPVIREVSPEVGEPLELIEAADVLRIRRRNARELFSTAIFRKAYNAALDEYRDGEKAASLRTMVLVRDDPGAGKAADRKVRLEASKALMGEDSGPTVNVGVAVSAHVTPGIVVRRYQPPPTIEHALEPNRGSTIDG